METPEWVKEGTIVKLKKGWTGMKIVRVEDGLTADFEDVKVIHANYKDYDFPCEFADKIRDWDKFEPYEGENSFWFGEKKEEEEEEQMKKLYTWNDGNKDCYGHRLAVNSAGMWVMEEKSSSGLIAIDKKDICPVIPHSVTIKFHGSNSTYDYWAPAGRLEVGNMVLMADGQFVKVVAIDTKSDLATKSLKGLIIQGEVLGDESDG